MTDYKILIQNTTDKQYFVSGFTDQEDSKIYYHIEEFVFPEGYPDGEYRYYVIPKTSEEITADNNHIYVAGEEIEPLATGLMVLGEYSKPVDQYNKKDTFIQYE